MYIAGTLLLIFLVLQCSGCSGIQKVTDTITNPTAREIYKREFRDNEQVYNNWQAAYQTALTDSTTVSLPYVEKGKFSTDINEVYTYDITLEEGEVLIAEVIKDSSTQRVFIEVLGSDTTKPEKAEINRTQIKYIPDATGTYKVIIQPEIAADTPFTISIYKRPQYSFPVAGKGNADVGSFWGMERDGGKRRHEGIDIFAKKGTPVVAATDGFITYTGERGLGGKQVWLRDGMFGKSLYYAHLDSIAVQGSATVKTGDTLGFVGNTGNARFTPPHLHFGIYTGRGAVNPLPFVFKTNKPEASGFTFNYTALQLKTKATANLRQGPSTSFNTIGQLTANDTIQLLGQHHDWLHIITRNGKKAFLHKSLAREIK
ncbi:peptidoglycan DD-metalloendopeptidase family protein [Flavobacterium sp. D11R37]|nr:peptidoglycan DD-metalloendopeptidase family protein [Flavobacterium coralii]